MVLYPTPQPLTFWSFGMTVIPASPAVVISQTTTLSDLYLSNTTASAVTVTLTDGSTEASGSPCQIIPTVSVPANSILVVNLGGVVANGGVSWSAGTASAVHAYLRGGY